jgi:hypothetical protein
MLGLFWAQVEWSSISSWKVIIKTKTKLKKQSLGSKFN